MRCNIDARGKAVRLKTGILVLLAAAAVAVLCLAGVLTAAGWWWAALGATLSGAFVVFEARSGWCVLRAMGFKTPL